MKEDIIKEDVLAAISMAIHLFAGDLHDTESGVLTIKRQCTDWNNLSLVMRSWPK